ncbi:hypothetical protein TSUD_211680 [Trifolium subterraneum]|uniref:IBB domain-containing protein n=1 Tax=Trifolium subterraneum TaxID=3900 RepID=A0A2Z6MEM8_TRISU|nr:hypothetical protein TSUD_211680 [Trifolium subterraneum]
MKLRPNNKTNLRRNRYKVAVDAEDGRRKREDDMIQIRKNNRKESLQKKRRAGESSQFPTVEHKEVLPMPPAAAVSSSLFSSSFFVSFVQIRVQSCSV